MTFQTTIIIIAEIILAISIIIMVLTMYKQRSSFAYPPIISDCPDYWSIDGTTCKQPAVNTGLLTDAKCPNVNFGIPIYKGNNGLCEKQKWAKVCNVTWDGITNNNDLCH